MAEHPPELLSLLQASKEAPDDPGPRLVLADWLEDHGQTDRAECVRLSVRLERLPWLDQRRSAWRDELDDPRRATGRWLAPLRRRIADVEFQGGLLRASPGVFGLLHDRPEDIPEEYLPWLETLRPRGFTTAFQLVQLARRGWLRRFTALDLAGTGLGDGAMQMLGELGHVSRLDFGDNQLTDAGVQALVAAEAHLPALRWLDLGSNRLSYAAVEALAASPLLGRLTSLDLSGASAGAAGVVALAGSRYIGRLVHLNLMGVTVGVSGLEALAGSKRLGELRSLELTGERLTSRSAARALRQWPAARPLHRLRLWDVGSSGVVGALAESGLCTSLQELTIGGGPVPPSDLAKLLGSLAGTGLRRLILFGLGIGDQGAAAVADCSALAGLRELDLWTNGLGAKGARALARSAHLGGLESLILDGNNLGPDGFRALTGAAGGAEPFPALRALGLNRTRPTKQGIAALAGSALLGRLECLDLSENRLGPAATALLAGSPRVAGLRHLKLYQCGVRDEGVAHLGESPYLTGLLSLNLRYNGLTNAAATALAASRLTGVTAIDLNGNQLTESGGAALLAWKPGEWARFQAGGQRLSAAMEHDLTAKGVKSS